MRMGTEGRVTEKLAAAVMGYGTIGSGVVEILEQNKEVIAKRAGREIEVKYVLDLRDFPGTPVAVSYTHLRKNERIAVRTPRLFYRRRRLQ